MRGIWIGDYGEESGGFIWEGLSVRVFNEVLLV